jgi:hypothetical protein
MYDQRFLSLAASHRQNCNHRTVLLLHWRRLLWERFLNSETRTNGYIGYGSFVWCGQNLSILTSFYNYDSISDLTWISGDISCLTVEYVAPTLSVPLSVNSEYYVCLVEDGDCHLTN